MQHKIGLKLGFSNFISLRLTFDYLAVAARFIGAKNDENSSQPKMPFFSIRKRGDRGRGRQPKR